MAGQAKFEDSNIALLGSDLELEVRKRAAETEEAYKGAGEGPGIQIWRVEQFEVVKWPKKQYGTFYSGDSFIVLHTYKHPNTDKLLHDIFFWLGSQTSQDEKCVAAYMTVVLDDLLGTLPVQFREVQHFESDAFMALWDDKMRVMEGGVASGFHHVGEDEYKDRLLKVKGGLQVQADRHKRQKGSRNHVQVKEVELRASSMNQGDVFILDHGLIIFQWNGEKAGVFERRKAGEVANALCEERNGKPDVEVVDGLEDHKMWEFLPGDKDEIKSVEEGGDDAEIKLEEHERVVYSLSDEGGNLETDEIARGDISRAELSPDDAFIIDLGNQIFVWIGADASKDEQRKGIKYATDFLITSGRPLETPIVRIVQGRETEEFNKVFDGRIRRSKNDKDGDPCCVIL